MKVIIQIKTADHYNPSDNHISAQSMSLATVRGEFALKCGEAADMAALIEKNLNGLRERSVFALVQQDTNKPGRSLQHLQYSTGSHEIDPVYIFI